MAVLVRLFNLTDMPWTAGPMPPRWCFATRSLLNAENTMIDLRLFRVGNMRGIVPAAGPQPSWASHDADARRIDAPQFLQTEATQPD